MTEVRIEGTVALARAEDVEAIAHTRPSQTVRLLPGFDQYVLGPGTGNIHIVPAAHRAEVSRTAGWISPVVVAGGRVVGTWETRDSRLEVTLFPETRRVEPVALEAEAGRIAALLGVQLTLAVCTT